MVNSTYIETLTKNSSNHESTCLECGCKLMVFEFGTDVKPRTLIHRCATHQSSMVVDSDMAVYQQYKHKENPDV